MTVPTGPSVEPAQASPDGGADLEPLLANRTVDLGRAVLATVALMFLAGAAVYAWQQEAHRAEPNEVDIGFADDMRTHHLQGVEMALVYLEGGTDPVLRQTAKEVIILQAGESRLLGQMLEDWGSPDLDLDNAMAWMDMAPVPQTEQPGMATAAELAELAAAGGEERDDQFSRLIVLHHRGGLHMASFAVEHGQEEVLTDLAAAIEDTQSSEIAEINQYRESLGLDPA